MAAPQNTQQEQKATAGQNAKRYGKLGLLAGAIMGLLSGGGFPAIAQMALIGGGAAALGGGVAGNKINPLFDKVMGMLPGRNKAPQTPQQPAVEIPELDQNRQPVFRLENEPEQDKTAGKADDAYKSVDAIDSTVRENARAAMGASIKHAGEGMDPDAKPMSPAAQSEWVSREAAGKRPTHTGPSISQ